MAFLQNMFKGKSRLEKAPERKETPAAKEADVKEGSAGSSLSFKGAVLGVLERPHVTERSAALADMGKYVFIVSGNANKNAVRRAVEKQYDVRVTAVNIISVPGKVRSRGRFKGWKSGFKKAIVTLKEGQSIEIQ